GGTPLMHHGPTMIEQNPRAGDGGFYMGPLSNQVFATSHDRDYPLESGEEFLIAYRPAPWRMKLRRKTRDHAHTFQMDPLQVIKATVEKQDSKELKRLKK